MLVSYILLLGRESSSSVNNIESFEYHFESSGTATKSE